MSQATAKMKPPREKVSKRKRMQTRVACNNCRRLRIKCDGMRPACSRCGRGKVQCEYDTKDENESRYGARERENELLRQRNDQLETLFSVLRAGSYGSGLEVLDLLRQNDLTRVLEGLASIVPAMRSVSPHPTARALSPPTSSRLEYELSVAHARAYPALLSSVDGAPLCRSMTASGIAGPASAMSSDRNSGDTRAMAKTSTTLLSVQDRDPSIETNISTVPWNTATSNETPFYGPAPSQYCDPRLYRLNISDWTDVEVSIEFAAELISFYLSTDHACLPFFDADLFLRDLVERRSEFCSPFLVNAVLLHASVAYTANDLRAASLSSAFRLVVEKLWTTARNEDSQPTVAAASLLQVTCSQICESDLAADFGQVSRQMAARLHLLRERTGDWVSVEHSNDWQRAASHTSWGIFNLSSLWTFYLHDVAPYPPPLFPIPGEPPSADNLLAPSLPPYMGRTFPSLCKLWLIAYEFINIYYSNLSTPVVLRVPIAFAESIYQRLLLWAAEHLNNNKGQPRIHHEAIMQVYFHLVVIELMRPFAESETTFFHNFSYPESTPNDALRASTNQLKRFVRDYRTMFGSSVTTMILQPALMYVANALIIDRADPDRDYYLKLCFVEHTRLSLQYPLAPVLLEGLLAVAVAKKALSLESARLFLKEAKMAGAARSLANGEASETRFVADHSLALTDHVGARIDALSERFRDRLMFHELTADC